VVAPAVHLAIGVIGDVIFFVGGRLFGVSRESVRKQGGQRRTAHGGVRCASDGVLRAMFVRFGVLEFDRKADS
jgi:hypothetical protein